MKCAIRKCCCCELRWGALIIALIDMIATAAVVLETKYLAYYEDWCMDHNEEVLESSYYFLAYYTWIIALFFHFAHLMSCVLVIASVWVQNKNLLIVYLITGAIRIIYDFIFFIYVCVAIGAMTLTLLLIGCGFGVAIYFWVVAYSWFKMIQSPAGGN
ncbi:uncharacterized protein LOC6529996 [Drosophila yakuba]|uniref:Uncharacterized protein n=1 Tax=Drosophila yakuba TaxID=7245 RepID=B4P4L5_DROYA|nr:uncharacterized protein LOC6529996 [Drosophila yakuba]EDW90654.1 uncharacterized protein Dyak_GE13388 [Drosophila yakuba]